MKNINVAIAVIVEKDKVLLTQRYDPTNLEVHLKWQLPGGKIEKNEKAYDACIREAYEETGFKIKLLTITPAKIENIYSNTKFLLHGFKAKVISGTIDVEKDHETADCKWYTKSQIKKLDMLENTVEMIEKCTK